MRPVVVKLGGSLGEGPGARARLAGLLAQIVAGPPALIVGGGGTFAEAVRIAQGDLGFSDALAHRLAIAGMASFAAVLAEIEPGVVATATLEGAAAVLAAGRHPVWTAAEAAHPERLAAEALLGRAGSPARERSWRVTSDSLAAFAAHGLGASRLVMVKSAAPGAAASLEAAAAAGLVDAAFPAAAAGLEVRLLGPEDHQRLAAAVAGSPVGRVLAAAAGASAA